MEILKDLDKLVNDETKVLVLVNEDQLKEVDSTLSNMDRFCDVRIHDAGGKSLFYQGSVLLVVDGPGLVEVLRTFQAEGWVLVNLSDKN